VDFQLEQWVNSAAGHSPLLDDVMVALAKWSEITFIALVAGWLLWGLITRASNRREAAVAALLASGLALAVNQLVSLVWSRPRPFAAHPGRVHVLLGHSADASFPSDHVAAAVAIAVVVISVHQRVGLLTLLVALAVGFARVFVGDHYPGDVGGGGWRGWRLPAVQPGAQLPLRTSAWPPLLNVWGTRSPDRRGA